MISNVRIRNFKCLRDVTIDLERFTMLVGPNASGKSSILQALNLLCWIFRAPQQMNQDAEISKEVSRGSNESVELAAETGGQWYRYRPGSRPSPQPFFVGPAFGHDVNRKQQRSSCTGASPPPGEISVAISLPLSSTVLLLLHP